MPEFLTDLLQRREVLAAGLLLSVALLAGIGWRVRKIAKSDRPDEPLSNLAMLVGLGWSSEAVWEITGRLEWPTSLRVLLFFVLETLLVLSMIRAKRAVKEIGHPGRSGRTVWIVASAMALVAVGASSSFGEAILRLVIPLLLVRQWWDGLVGEGPTRRKDASSWRWTPRRLLLALGAIEPGERDIETVNRERLTQQMTRLEFRRRHGSERKQKRSARKLARLSLSADVTVIDAVRERVDRATWFEVKHQPTPTAAPQASIPASQAVSAKARRAFHNRRLRALRVKQAPAPVSAVQVPEPDPRSKQDIESAVCFMAAAPDAPNQRQIAHLLRTSPATVNRALRRKQNPSPPPHMNGRRPELEGAIR